MLTDTEWEELVELSKDIAFEPLNVEVDDDGTSMVVDSRLDRFEELFESLSFKQRLQWNSVVMDEIRDEMIKQQNKKLAETGTDGWEIG